jgi:DNA mismatch repair ATPase MutL
MDAALRSPPCIQALDASISDSIEAGMHISCVAKIVTILLTTSLQMTSIRNIKVIVDFVNLKIEIVDDGDGMSYERLQMVGRLHTELDFLTTLSDVYIDTTTNISTFNINMQRACNSKRLLFKNVDLPTGTRIIVSNIFKRFYSRRFMIRDTNKEMSKIKTSILPFVMLHYDISFQIFNMSSGMEALSIPTHNSVESRFAFVHGDFDSIIPISIHKPDYNLSGFIHPEFIDFSQQCGQYAYINGKHSLSLLQSIEYTCAHYKISSNLKKHFDYTSPAPSFFITITFSESCCHSNQELLLATYGADIYQAISCFLSDVCIPLDPVTSLHQYEAPLNDACQRQAIDISCFNLLEGNNESPQCRERDPGASLISDEIEIACRVSVERAPSNPLIEHFDSLLSDSTIVSDELLEEIPHMVFAPEYDDISKQKLDNRLPTEFRWDGELLTERTILPSKVPRASLDVNLDDDFKRGEGTIGGIMTESFVSSDKVSKTQLRYMRAIGQADCKYIFSIASSRILCFDQHAVDERIKLEELSVVSISSMSSQQSVSESLTLARCDLSILLEQECLLIDWGFRWRLVPKNQMIITQVPVIAGEPLTAPDFLEFITLLRESSDLPVKALRPPAVQRILASKACRSAIKFGDVLTLANCSRLLKELSSASLPFQCAHGRPSVAPLQNIAALHKRRKVLLKQSTFTALLSK